MRAQSLKYCEGEKQKEKQELEARLSKCFLTEVSVINPLLSTQNKNKNHIFQNCE